MANDDPMDGAPVDNKPAPAPGPVGSVLTVAALAALYLLGLAHWEFFFDHGGIYFPGHDWPKEHMYYAVLRQAIETGSLPLHTDRTEWFHGTGRFLANPEVNWSPQILALPWMDTGRFIIWNVCVLYTAGFVGLLLLRRRYALGLLPFTFLFLLFNFNGTPTAHLGVGHSMWCGHFLMPFFYLYLLELAEDATATRAALKLAATFFFIFLQGAFHYFVWSAMFLGLFIAFNRRLLRPGLLALGTAGLLLAVRLLPTAVAFWHDQKHDFITGYPTSADLLAGFVSIHQPGSPSIGRVYNSLAWQEYDIYMSIPGFALFLIFGIFMRFSRDPMFSDLHFAAFDKPILVQSLLSFSDLYVYITQLPIPLLNGERVSSRFLIVPAMLLLIFAAIRMQRFLQRTPWPGRAVFGIGLAGAIAATAFFLYQHSVEWCTGRQLAVDRERWPDADLSVHVLSVSDPIYVAVLAGSALVTVLAWAAWVYCYCRPGELERLVARFLKRRHHG